MPDRVGKRWGMLNKVITAAVANQLSPIFSLAGCAYLVVTASLAYVASAGTTIDVYVQTSLDGGLTWVDIMNFHFTTASAIKTSAVVATTALAAAVTPTDGSIASNTILSGLLGDMFRLKYTSVGTYGALNTVKVDAVAKAAA